MMGEADNRVYITNYNYQRIIKAYANLYIELNDDVKSQIYKDDLSWMLTSKEFLHLFIEKLILSAGAGFDLKAKLIDTNNSKYLFQSGPPKYHINPLCDFMKSDFKNLTVPPEIEERGPEERARFTAFVKENSALIELDPEQFSNKAQARFLLKNPPAQVKFDNSGSRQFTHLSLDELEVTIEAHVEKCKQYKKQNPEMRLIYADPEDKNCSNSIKRGTDADKQWHEEYKKPLKNMLRGLIAKRTSPDLSHSKSYLESFGFKPCSACDPHIDF